MADPDLWDMGSEFFRQQVRDSCRVAVELAEQLEGGKADTVLPRVKNLWIEAELPSHCPQAWARLWAAVRRAPDPARVMSARERRTLRALADPVTVFRGARAGGERGWSWTLRRSVALEFAVRYTEPGDVASQARLCIARVHTTDVIAYFRLGGEDEVIIDPGSIDWDAVRIVRP